MGSKDRKLVKGWCYDFLRLGNALCELQPEKRLAIGSFLCAESNAPSLEYLLSEFYPELLPSVPKVLEEKLENIKELFPGFSEETIFPLFSQLSSFLDKDQFIRSMFIQPDIFIRIKKGKKEKVLEELRRKNIPCTSTIEENAFAVNRIGQADKLETYQSGDFEFQDLMSQRCRTFFQPEQNESWWDACAASGGKSLLLLDLDPSVKITATDIRESALKNYSGRLNRSGYNKNFNTHLADLRNPVFTDERFDGIIADVPCSGSGTWSRNPEWIGHSSLQDLQAFVMLQRSIVNNLLPALKTGKPIIYITCSAFFIENVLIIQFFEREYGLQSEQMQYLSGSSLKADTLFVCRMKKP
jgi:16S rRNA (cytosine967-C5)-methyltransferase